MLSLKPRTGPTGCAQGWASLKVSNSQDGPDGFVIQVDFQPGLPVAGLVREKLR
jgi:hypothetical protein